MGVGRGPAPLRPTLAPVTPLLRQLRHCHRHHLQHLERVTANPELPHAGTNPCLALPCPCPSKRMPPYSHSPKARAEAAQARQGWAAGPRTWLLARASASFSARTSACAAHSRSRVSRSSPTCTRRASLPSARRACACRVQRGTGWPPLWVTGRWEAPMLRMNRVGLRRRGPCYCLQAECSPPWKPTCSVLARGHTHGLLCAKGTPQESPAPLVLDLHLAACGAVAHMAPARPRATRRCKSARQHMV